MDTGHKVEVLARILADVLADDFNLEPQDVVVEAEYLECGIGEWDDGDVITFNFRRLDKKLPATIKMQSE